MRRLFVLLVLACFLAPPSARADGLYKGHGRRSVDLWDARLNLTGGIHGATDPYRARGSHDWGWATAGGFAQAGLEVRERDLDSLELFVGLRSVGSSDSYRVGPFGGGSTDTIRDRSEINAVHAGLTVRHYILSRSSESYFGAGAGVVRAESVVQEFINGVESFRFDGDDTAGELHILAGWERSLGEPLTLGVEVGYRWTWLEAPSDFEGAFLALKLGITN